jgi:hypothetical protein
VREREREREREFASNCRLETMQKNALLYKILSIIRPSCWMSSEYLGSFYSDKNEILYRSLLSEKSNHFYGYLRDWL